MQQPPVIQILTENISLALSLTLQFLVRFNLVSVYHQIMGLLFWLLMVLSSFKNIQFL